MNVHISIKNLILLMASTFSSSKIKKKKNFKYYDNLVNSEFCV